MDAPTQMMSRKVEVELTASLMAAAEQVAAKEGTSLEAFIRSALAEKISRTDQEAYFAARVARARPGRALEILASLKRDGPVVAGDEVE